MVTSRPRKEAGNIVRQGEFLPWLCQVHVASSMKKVDCCSSMLLKTERILVVVKSPQICIKSTHPTPRWNVNDRPERCCKALVHSKIWDNFLSFWDTKLTPGSGGDCSQRTCWTNLKSIPWKHKKEQECMSVCVYTYIYISLLPTAFPAHRLP